MNNSSQPTELNQPFGRQLSDLWLDGEDGKLHPAEWRLLACAQQGKPCILGNDRPAYKSSKNCLRADLIRFLALGGDPNYRVHEHGVQLVGAFVECSKGVIDLNGASVKAHLNLIRCNIGGTLLLQDTTVPSLTLIGSQIEGLVCDSSQIKGDVLLANGFVAHKEVRLSGAKIGGDLSCGGGEFRNDSVAIHCDRMVVEGAVFMDTGFHAHGTVSMMGSELGGDLSFRDARLICAGSSLDLESASVEGRVFLDDGFLAYGTIDLSNISVLGNLQCNRGTFSAKDKAIHAPRAKIGGNINLGAECRVAGEISFQSANISGDITFSGGSFETKGTINIRNASVGGMFIWREVTHARGELNLSGASCLTLNMDWTSWKKPSQVRLDNFTYRGFSELPKGCNAAFWIEWLERQPSRHLEDRFRPKPYKQLAFVLNDMGHEEESRSIRIALRKRQANFSQRHDPELNREKRWLKRLLLVFWNFVQRVVVAYGYRPGNALFYLAGLIIIGSGIYHTAARDGIMTPTHPLIYKEAVGGFIPSECAHNWVYFPKAVAEKCQSAIPSEYSEFNAFMYSLDTAIPVVDFRIESDWAPRVVDTEGERYWPGWWVRSWEWVQIGAGWALSLLFVSAIGGIIRRE